MRRIFKIGLLNYLAFFVGLVCLYIWVENEDRSDGSTFLTGVYNLSWAYLALMKGKEEGD